MSTDRLTKCPQTEYKKFHIWHNHKCFIIYITKKVSVKVFGRVFVKGSGTGSAKGSGKGSGKGFAKGSSHLISNISIMKHATCNM